MDATTLRAFKMTTATNELKKIGDYFGIGEKLLEQVGDKVADFAKQGEEWAEATAAEWESTAPWETGTLRESITYSVKNPAKPVVFVDRNELSSHYDETRSTKRAIYRKLGIEEHTVPNFDYTEAIDRGVRRRGQDYHAVSAGEEPQSQRDYWMGGHTPFIEPFWFRIAEQNASFVDGYKGRVRK